MFCDGLIFNILWFSLCILHNLPVQIFLVSQSQKNLQGFLAHICPLKTTFFLFFFFFCPFLCQFSTVSRGSFVSSLRPLHYFDGHPVGFLVWMLDIVCIIFANHVTKPFWSWLYQWFYLLFLGHSFMPSILMWFMSETPIMVLFYVVFLFQTSKVSLVHMAIKTISV